MDEEYRADLKAIARNDLSASIPLVSIKEPASHGWQRRSELDGAGVEVWELPDGSLAGIATSNGV